MSLLKLALLSLLVSLASAQTTCPSGDAACRAYVWGVPLWRAVNGRYLNQFYSPLFAANGLTARVSVLPDPLNLAQVPQLAVCNATMCSGVSAVLNPAPIVSPNVDSIYGSITWDLGTDNSGALKFAFPNPAGFGTRYASAVFYDHFTNVVFEINNVAFPNGAVVCFAQLPNHPACTGLTQITLPRLGFSIIRVYTDGSPAVCGLSGCQFLLAVLQNFAVISAPANVQSYVTTYGTVYGYTGCPYTYKFPPCTAPIPTINQTRFWDAICQILKDNTITDSSEINYITQNFANLGITPTGCGTLDYATLVAGMTAGNAVVNQNLWSGINSGPWSFIPFNGQWQVGNDQQAIYRAAISTRLEYMNSNGFAAYWAASQDSTLAALNGAGGATYKLVWQSSTAFVDPTKGFWSITGYDSSFFMYPAVNDQRQYAIRGTGAPTANTEIHVANTCVTSNCIRVNPGPFNLMLRAYAPLANSGILPAADGSVSYQLPTLVKCPCSSPCN